MFGKFTRRITDFTGTSLAFGLAVFSVFLWVVACLVFGFNEIVLLIGNSFLSIITYWLVFLIQNSQDRDTKALHEKIDELIRVNTAARDELIGIEKEDAT